MSGQLAATVMLTVAVLLVASGAGLVLRRAFISGRGGVIECYLRHGSDRPWQHGLAEYRRGQLYWHRSMSLRLRPHAAFERSQIVVLASRSPESSERARLIAGMVIVSCRALVRHRGRPAKWRELELALSEEARTGLLAWLEASPTYPIRRVS